MESHTASQLAESPDLAHSHFTALALAWGDQTDCREWTAADQRSAIAAILFAPSSASDAAAAGQEHQS